MTLQGSLDSFALADVLRLLASTKKSGRLKVEGEGGHGDLWLDGGALVEATAERNHEIPDALVELLRLEGGDFVFVDDEGAPNGGDPMEVDAVLAEADGVLEEWRGIEAVVPHMGCRVAPAAVLPDGSVTIDQGQWAQLLHIGEGRSVADLGARLELGELKVGRVVRDLVEAGLVEVSEGVADTVADAPADATTTADGWAEPAPVGNPFEAPEHEEALGDPGAPDEVDQALQAELNGDAAAGSSDVALDAALGSSAEGHSYLNGSAGTGPALPEALPGSEGELDADAAARAANPFTHEPVPGA